MRYTSANQTNGSSSIFSTPIQLTHKFTLSRDPVNPTDAASKNYVDTSISSSLANINAHINNNAIHAKVGQKTFLDSITVSPTEINNISGIVYDVQSAINDKLNIAGDTTANYILLNSDPTAPNQVVTKQYIDSKTQGNLQLRTGIIIEYPSNYTPIGFLRCNGAAVDKTTYSVLYSIIGDTYNTTFNPGAGRPWCQQYGFNTSQSSDITGWTTGTPIPAALVDFQAIVTKNRVYMLGGFNGYISNAYGYTAPINPDGTLGAWADGTGLPSPLSGYQAILTKNRVYILGGWYSGNARSTVYTAPINTDGTLGAWTTGTSLPTALANFQAIATSRRVYILGGAGSYAVYSAPINIDGTLGAWTTGPSLPATVPYSQAIVTNNRVYLPGGYSGDSLYSAPINTDGTLGTWSIETPLPNNGDRPQAVVTNNRVYLLGGYNGSTSNFTAPINPDGTLGTWTTGTDLPDALSNSQVIVTSSRVYLLGGRDANGAISSTVYTAPFSGGLNDYSPYYNGTYTTPDPTKFKLPDMTNYKNTSDKDYFVKF